VRLFTWPYNPKRFGVIQKSQSTGSRMRHLIRRFKDDIYVWASKQIAEFLKNTYESRDPHAMSHAIRWGYTWLMTRCDFE